MRKNIYRIACALVLCALTSAFALAGPKTRAVTFREDVTVNGTLIKKGAYKVTFDEKSNELTIADGKKIIAKTAANLEAPKGVMKYTQGYVTEKGGARSSVNMDGKHIVIKSDNAAARASSAATSVQ